MTVSARGRHRAPCRPITPLTLMVQATQEVAGTASRRTVVAVATGSLMATSMVFAAPMALADDTSVSADVQALTAQARAIVDAAPAVVVAETAVWTVEDASIKVKAAPKPDPEPTVAAAVTRSTSTISRASSRAALTDEPKSTSSSNSATSSSKDSTNSKANNSVDVSDVDLTDIEQRGQAIVDIAKRYVGISYVYGGTTPAGFDCSGFTSYVYNKVGISLPRTSSAQRYAGKVVSAADALPGDLVWNPGHIAIYVGGGKIIDSPRPGKSISVRDIWYSNPVFIRIAK